MKNSILVKTLALVLLTVVLSAALTALVFTYSGRLVFSGMKAQELKPRAAHIASITADYMQGFRSAEEYRRTIESKYPVWDAALYVFDDDKAVVVQPVDSDRTAASLIDNGYLEQVLSGNGIVSSVTDKNTGVMIGEPVVSIYGSVIGAVFLIKPIAEVNAALSSMTFALVVSMVIASVLMLVPAYFGSRGLARPLSQMSAAAQAMARGDFSVRAHAAGNNEVSELGRSLNFLSAALSNTINELTFERNRLRAVLDGLGEGIIAVNAQKNVTHCNPAAIRLLGGTPGEPYEVLTEFPTVLYELCETMQSGITRVREVTVNNSMIRIATTALLDAEGVSEGAVALVQDITESERLEQTRREYVANVSHELRTPIASIRSLADALNDGLVKKSEDAQRYYGYILKESMRLSRLIDDLLELSRLQSGAVALTKQRFDPTEILADVADRYTKAAKEKGMSITLDVPAPCPMAYSNPDRAEQVLIAMLDNAIKHTHEGGEIEISAREAGEKLVISVVNPGSISEEDRQHLFDRFYKVDKSHSGGGTGLGLAIAREVLALLDEVISVKCENGKVAFSFTLTKYVK